jgi:hypothetical protein
MTDNTDSTNFASTNLVSGSWNSDTNEMRITFGRGKTYVWDQISESQWIGLKSAPSPGNYLRDNFPAGSPE